MENLNITDHVGDSVELIEAGRTDGRVHLHTRRKSQPEQGVHCVHLQPSDQAKIHMWLGQLLGAATIYATPVDAESQPVEQQTLPAVTYGPSVRLRVGEGETMREVVWDTALPSESMFELAARVLLTGDDQLQLDPDGRRARVIELRRENLVLEQQRDELTRSLDSRGERVLELERELKQRMTEGKEQERRLINARNEANDRARAAREALDLAEETSGELSGKLNVAREALAGIAADIPRVSPTATIPGAVGEWAVRAESLQAWANTAREALQASNPDA